MTTPAPAPVGTVIHIDPHKVVVAQNIRANADLGRDGFSASIADRGVTEPVLGWWDADAGAFQILVGQRRTLAARDARRPTIPLFVVAAVEEERERILSQFMENEHRKELDQGERVDAVRALFDLGMTPDQIRRKTHKPRRMVEVAIKVATSEPARQALDTLPSLDLVLAAEIADLTADGRELPSSLVRLMFESPDQVPNELAILRQQREDDVERDAAVAAEVRRLTDAGHTAYPHEVPDGLEVTPHPVSSYRMGNGAHVPPSTWDAISPRTALVRGSTFDTTAAVEWLVDPLTAANAGLHLYAPALGGTDEDEAEQRREQRRLTAEWKAATKARRQVIAEHLANSIASPPKKIAVWYLVALAAAGRFPAPANRRAETAAVDLAAEWLAVRDEDTPLPLFADVAGTPADPFAHARFEEWADEHQQRHQNLIAAFAIARVEAAIQPRAGFAPWDPDATTPAAARYLEALSPVGYTLTPIERRIINASTSYLATLDGAA